MNSPLVSTVKNAAAVATQSYAAHIVLEAIRSGGKKLREQIQQIRNRFEAELAIAGDYKAAKRAVDTLKKALPAVLWSGQFTERANTKLIKHSGLVCADLDNFNSELLAVRAKLLASPHLWAVFTSPSSDGLKAVFRVPPDPAKHAVSFRAVEHHVKELTGVQIDGQCKEVSRLCFLSYDPDLYHNASAVELEPLPEPERPARPLLNGVINLNERQSIATELLGPVDWQSETSGFVVCPGKHLHTAGDNETDCKIDLDNAPTVHCFHNSCRCIIEGVNHTLRSRIGKAEYGSNNANSKTTVQTEAADGDDEAVELPPAPAPYIPPPLALLPSELQDYIYAAAESLNVDVSFILLPLLSGLGSGIGNARSILLKPGFIQSPIIWTGIIGRSGGRKSPALDAACFTVMEHERDLTRQNKDTMTAYGEELAQWERKQRKDRGPKPEPPPSLTCLMDDLTLAALAEAIEANPRGVLVKKDELSHWFAAMDQFHDSKGSDVSRWLSLHTGVVFGFDRKTERRRFRLWYPRVCISGGIQPGVLTRVLTQDFFERGLPARFLFAAPPVRKDRWSEDTIPERSRNVVSQLFSALYELQPDQDNGERRPRLLRLDADAREAFAAYYNDCGDAALTGDEREEAAWSKLSGYAARLALVGQLAGDPQAEILTGEVMRAACDLARWFGAEAIRIYATLSETAEQAEQRRLVEFIGRRGGAVTERDAYTNYWPLRNDKEKTEQTLTALVKAGRGKWESVATTAKGGKPTRILRLLHTSASAKPLLL